MDFGQCIGLSISVLKISGLDRIEVERESRK
jgi:hypothetical protein